MYWYFCLKSIKQYNYLLTLFLWDLLACCLDIIITKWQTNGIKRAELCLSAIELSQCFGFWWSWMIYSLLLKSVWKILLCTFWSPVKTDSTLCLVVAGWARASWTKWTSGHPGLSWSQRTEGSVQLNTTEKNTIILKMLIHTPSTAQISK